MGNDVVAFLWTNSPDADRVATLVAQLFFVKTQTHPVPGNENELVVAGCKVGVDQAIARFDLNGDDSPFPDIGVIREIRFFDDTGASSEDDVQILVPGIVGRVRARAGTF